jgi:hypothetical protein
MLRKIALALAGASLLSAAVIPTDAFARAFSGRAGFHAGGFSRGFGHGFAGRGFGPGFYGGRFWRGYGPYYGACYGWTPYGYRWACGYPYYYY